MTELVAVFDSTQLVRLQASRYVSAAGLVVLLYDHILTFSDEVSLIWPAKFSLPKVLFLFNRYVVPIAMIIETNGFSGVATPLLTDKLWVTNCQGWTSAITFVGMISIASGNLLVLLRLWVLWERSFFLICWTLGGFVVTQLASIALTTYTVLNMIPDLSYSIDLHACLFRAKINFAVLWVPGIAFEVMIFLTTVWNAFDRPRSDESQMSRVLYRDGCVYFLVLFALRIINLVLAITAPLSLIFLGVFFIWCATNVTVTRLILNLRRLSSPGDTEIDDSPDIPDHPASAISIVSQEYELQPKGSQSPITKSAFAC